MKLNGYIFFAVALTAMSTAVGELTVLHFFRLHERGYYLWYTKHYLDT